MIHKNQWGALAAFEVAEAKPFPVEFFRLELTDLALNVYTKEQQTNQRKKDMNECQM